MSLLRQLFLLLVMIIVMPTCLLHLTHHHLTHCHLSHHRLSHHRLNPHRLSSLYHLALHNHSHHNQTQESLLHHGGAQFDVQPQGVLEGGLFSG